MRAAFRRFLLLLLMLTLPVQAFAAASMLGCALSSPAQPVESASPSCHDADPADLPAQHECKHCALCFLAGAQLIPSPILAPFSALAPVDLPSLTVVIGCFIPDGPERPPRLTLA
ncbi:MAG: hypothetical protein ABL877_03855 [Thiobacillus sp.]